MPEARAGSDAPPGWNYNPSSWGQRVPVILLALVGMLIATYLTLFQAGVLATVWDPFFGAGSRTILHSSVSRLLPIPAAALGALGYLADAAAGATGGGGCPGSSSSSESPSARSGSWASSSSSSSRCSSMPGAPSSSPPP